MADTRLEAQRRPRRLHARANSRWYKRGYTTIPHPPWGDVGGSINPPAGTVATGVTPGAPGSFTPAGATPVANYTALTARGAMGQTAAWTTGQYVILGDGTFAYWTGTAWAAGIAGQPPLDDPHVVTPGNFTIAEIQDWLDHHPNVDVARALRDHERAHSARVTLLDWLDGFIESLDGPD